jgi:hypothetical protein
MLFPLDADGKLYTIEDERGNRIATGTRVVCQQLMELLYRTSPSSSNAVPVNNQVHSAARRLDERLMAA